MDNQRKPSLHILYDEKDSSLVMQLGKYLDQFVVNYDGDRFVNNESAAEGFLNLLNKADGIVILITANSLRSESTLSNFTKARLHVLNSKRPMLLIPVLFKVKEIPEFVHDLQTIELTEKNHSEVAQRLDRTMIDFVSKNENAIYAANQSSEKVPASAGLEDDEEVVFESDIPGLKKDAAGSGSINIKTVSEPKENISNTKQQSAGKVTPGSQSSASNPPAGKKASENAPPPQQKTTGTVAVETKYWLLKMNPDVWPVHDLKEGDPTYFNTHHFQDKRPEFDLFQKVNVGDKVLGYAGGTIRSIVCEMEVTAPVGPDTKHGESFRMKVIKKLPAFLPLEKFRTYIMAIIPRLEVNKKPPELFFELSKEMYELVLKEVSEIKYFENNFEPFYLTEGNHRNTEDKLDFENDIESFASVIALKKVNPPLAIGLFGHWGSGKSFFMEKLAAAIEKKANSDDPDYVKNVVPVRFNSWHYSDSNLWASLITHIFESLNDYAIKKKYGAGAINQIYEKLEITGQQINETNSKIAVNDSMIADLKSQEVELQKKIEEKRTTLAMFNAGDIAGIILSDPQIKNDLQEIIVRINTTELSSELKGLDNVKQNLTKDINAVKNLQELLHQNVKGKRIWIPVAVVLFAIIMIIAYTPWFKGLTDTLNVYIKHAAAFISSVSAIVVFYRNKLSPHMQRLEQFYSRVKSVAATVDQKAMMTRLNEDVTKADLETEIKSLQTTSDSLKKELQQRETEKTELENQLKEIGSGRMLASFLATKSTDESYMKQLGIISWIRKDFSRLNDLFIQQEVVNENNEKQNIESAAIQLKIDRIVLYIDDLDRCNEDIVVKVLEAIHLLLAFELFVVVVGVDPRWLNNALSEKYKTLFGARKENGLSRENGQKKNGEKDNGQAKLLEEELFLSGVATSYDYLEKIFQIPFTLKPINKTGRENLIKYLIKDELAKEEIKVEDQTSTGNTVNLGNDGMKKILVLDDEAKLKEMIKQKVELDKAKIEIEKDKKVKQRLVFTNEELEYMQEISGLFGHSPRSINRYVNIYRIIKAHRGMKVVGDFSNNEFMPIMYMLGVVIGYSVFAQEFIDKMKDANNTQTLNDFIKNSGLNEKLVKAISVHTSDVVGSMRMEDFKRNLELISRFSFRTLLRG